MRGEKEEPDSYGKRLREMTDAELMKELEELEALPPKISGGVVTALRVVMEGYLEHQAGKRARRSQGDGHA